MTEIDNARRNTIGAAIQRAAKRWPNKIALSFEDRSWSFSDLEQAAQNVAYYLMERGVNYKDRVACYGQNSDVYLFAWLGCALSGAIHVPINYALKGKELSYIVNNSGASVVLYAPNLKEHLEPIEDDIKGVGLLGHPDFDDYDLSSLKHLYYGAAIMPEPVLQELSQRLPEAGLYNGYGQTEMGSLATILRPEEHIDRPTSAGKPVLFVETRIVDEDMQDVAVGEQGEIVHRSPQLLSGYWKNPAATEEAFKGGWFHSGDLGKFDSEGYLYIVDRIKDVVNTGGVLVASREVEEAIFSMPAVSEVAVIAVPDAKWVEAIAAVIVLRPDQTVTEDDVIAHCKTCLASYKVPRRVIFATELPKNASGKILKRELREHFSSSGKL